MGAAASCWGLLGAMDSRSVIVGWGVARGRWGPNRNSWPPQMARNWVMPFDRPYGQLSSASSVASGGEFPYYISKAGFPERGCFARRGQGGGGALQSFSANQNQDRARPMPAIGAIGPVGPAGPAGPTRADQNNQRMVLVCT